MIQNLEQIQYFNILLNKLEAELSKSQPNEEQVQWYRSQIDKLTSPSIPQPQAGKLTFKNISDIINHIICILDIICDFLRRSYCVNHIPVVIL
jgi:hypothetical protein